jgi:curli production assembly/transport component CsgF
MNCPQILLLISTITYVIQAGELIYTPVNPSFGGSPLNAQWLLSSAQTQNSYSEKSSAESASRSPVENFKESLNRQILSRFASQIVATAFGEKGADPLVEGSYQIGDFTIEVKPDARTLSIVVIDIIDGSETVIEIPYYGNDLGNQE